MYDPAIEPQAIQPIAAWKGKYGARGALRDCMALSAAGSTLKQESSTRTKMAQMKLRHLNETSPSDAVP
ncbi:MAG: hypothetical protein ACYC0T_16995 [Ramlibacter sp.]